MRRPHGDGYRNAHTGSCQFPLQQICGYNVAPTGWVTEWLIVHAWKACVLKGTGGSNPPPSAFDLLLVIVLACQAVALRSLVSCSLALPIAPFKKLQFLSQLDHAAVRQDAAKIHPRINHAIAADHRARIDDRVAADLRFVPDDGAEFS